MKSKLNIALEVGLYDLVGDHRDEKRAENYEAFGTLYEEGFIYARDCKDGETMFLFKARPTFDGPVSREEVLKAGYAFEDAKFFHKMLNS